MAAILAFAAPVAAQVAVDRGALERDTTILADDDMEGREVGTPGYDRAADYVAGRMEELGLDPGGDEGTYFQSVPLMSVTRAEAGNTLSIEGLGELEWGEDYIVRGRAHRMGGVIEAPLVFVGYGLRMEGRDDFAGVDLQGAIAVRISGSPDGLGSEEAAHYSSNVNQRLSDEGAIGVLLLSTPAMTQRFSWNGIASVFGNRSSTTWAWPEGIGYEQGANVMATGNLSPAMSARLLEGFPFDFDDLSAAERSAERIIPSFALNRTARISFKSRAETTLTSNVIGMVRGTDPSVSGEYIVVTAHLDHVGVRETEAEGDDEIYNGALDNAVGVASMLEVARLLRADPPRRPVLFVALGAEEIGLLGSSYHARNPGLDSGELVANVNIDMPVVTYDFSDVVAFGAERSSLFPEVAAATEEYGLILSPDPQPEQGFFTRSDQYSYVTAGIPAIYLDLGLGNGGEEAQGLVFDRHYHQQSDEVDLVDFAALERLAGVNYLIARNIANMAERPVWNAGDIFAPRHSAHDGVNEGS
ncbi:hypothetical protein AAW01_04800 [Aurantiacibacter gangjinensis]|uniref:Peptidase M28 domain-containing protein n=2 Tax=Aurantiacibacter gangjinensis TaxID=502682 RepID=A0A0G9MSI0_9SPHN|nr:hypothetical protein AAW01_04800 [Aurantiacibacter gangjinensis]